MRRNENENTCSITRKVRNIHEKQTKSKRKQTQKQTQIFTSPCKLPAKTSMARTANKRTANENKRKSKRILFRLFFFGKNKTLKLLGQLTEKGYITKFGNGRGTRYKHNA